MQKRPLIVVVDDDEAIRESLPDLLRQFGYSVAAFSSAEEFLDSGCLERARCLIVDIAMHGMSGFDLHDELTNRQTEKPTIFITARTEVDLRPRALAAGAVECLFKPFSEDALLGALEAALRSSESDGQAPGDV